MVGDAIPCGMEFPGNPVKIKFEKSVTLEKNYFVSANFDTELDAKALINSVPVRCVTTVTNDVVIANITIKQTFFIAIIFLRKGGRRC